MSATTMEKTAQKTTHKFVNRQSAQRNIECYIDNFYYNYHYDPTNLEEKDTVAQIWVLDNLLAENNTTENLVQLRDECVKRFGRGCSSDLKEAHEIYFDIIDQFLDEPKLMKGKYLAITNSLDKYPEKYCYSYLEKFFSSIVENREDFILYYHMLINSGNVSLQYHEQRKTELKNMYLKVNFKYVLELAEKCFDLCSGMIHVIYWFCEGLKETEPELSEALSKAFKKRNLKKLNEPFMDLFNIPDEFYNWNCEREMIRQEEAQEAEQAQEAIMWD